MMREQMKYLLFCLAVSKLFLFIFCGNQNRIKKKNEENDHVLDALKQ